MWNLSQVFEKFADGCWSLKVDRNFPFYSSLLISTKPRRARLGLGARWPTGVRRSFCGSAFWRGRPPPPLPVTSPSRALRVDRIKHPVFFFFASDVKRTSSGNRKKHRLQTVLRSESFSEKSWKIGFLWKIAIYSIEIPEIYQASMRSTERKGGVISTRPSACDRRVEAVATMKTK